MYKFTSAICPIRRKGYFCAKNNKATVYIEKIKCYNIAA